LDYTIKIGGSAGQGLQTIGDTLAKVLARSGYHVFSHQDYESRIRGGHNFYQIRFSDGPVMSSRKNIDLLVALDSETISRHSSELSDKGLVIYDPDTLKVNHESPSFLGISFLKLAIEYGGDRVMENTVATGAVLGIIGIDISFITDLLREAFERKSNEIISANIKAATAGYDYAIKNCSHRLFDAKIAAARKLLISGIDALALGCISSGLKFYSAYPMTPSTGIMNYISAHSSEFGVIVEQAEDEIAAINMAIGASFGGIRAMTGTSGGGFALMVEGLSLAAMTETPIVIALGQRPGPATGLPTRTEQGDLQFALHAAHGEFPRVILAPGSPEQAFHAAGKAFDLSEKYQIPAIIIFDQYLADCQWTLEDLDTGMIAYRDYRIRENDFKALSHYKRHEFTETGVSPLAVPGDAQHIVITDSDEHDENGHINEDAEIRRKMLDKRLFKKMPLVRKEISFPQLYGDINPAIVLTGWGSTYGLMKETVDVLSNKYGIAMLHFSELYPFPDLKTGGILKLLSEAKVSICIENNAGSQFARLMKTETGYDFRHSINRYDGRPFLLDELIGEIEDVIG